MDDTPYYSQTRINMALRCMKQYFFRYVEGIKEKPKAALTVGLSIDHGNNVNLTQKIITRKDLDEEDVLDAVSDKFDELSMDTNWDGEDQGLQKDLTINLSRMVHRKLAPSINPISVQESFKIITQEPYNLIGVIDYVEDNGTVVDFKTSKRPYTEDSITRNVQAALYDLAYELTYKTKSSGFRFDVAVKPTKTRNVQIQQVSGKVAESDREWLLNTVNCIHKAVEAGAELPAPDGVWWCCEKWCAYWHRCKGANK